MPAYDILRPYLLSANGDGTGTTNWNGDYSASQGRAYYAPGAGEIRLAHRLIVAVEDAGGMQAQEYGNLGGALTNGVAVNIRSQGTITNLTPNLITTNSFWGAYCYDADVKSWGAGNDLLVVRWTFTKDGCPIYLDGDQGDYVEALFNDNLSGLLGHYFLLKVSERGSSYSWNPDSPTEVQEDTSSVGVPTDAVAPPSLGVSLT
ncbi:MAG: hypothetical protein QNJ97_28680 [Myxococcota bacterium]|nr:hypothetical protein [Myxococcota bacterium]